MHVIVYGKPDCPLCDDLKTDLLALQAEFGFTLHERNIEGDAALNDRFRYLIPVVEMENGVLLYPPHRWHELHRVLADVHDSFRTVE